MENKKSKSIHELRELLAKNTEAMSLIDGLYDQGTFVQLGAYAKRVTTLADKGDNASDFEGVICGYGAIDGRLTFAFIQDNARMKGAFSDAASKKICALYDMAMKAGAPIIGVFDSNGAKIAEGVAAMAAYARVIKKSSDASGFIPQIALINGVCSGTAATFAAMSDFVIAHKSSKLYVVSPTDDGKTGGIATAAKSGICDILCKDAEEMVAKTKEILIYLPQNSESEAIIENDDDLNRMTPEVENLIAKSDVKKVIEAIADNGKVCSLAADYAPEMLCSFVSIGGFSCGIVANDPKINSGAITPAAADKAAGFINLCASFGLTVVTLVDSVGTTENADCAENYASSLASLAFSYAQSESPLVTAIIGKAYGVAATVLGSKSIGADVVFATENAEISPMSTEAAVEFLYSKEIIASEDPNKTRKEKTDIYNEEFASPLVAAKLGEIDDIIAADELRKRICYAIEMMNAGG